MKNLSILGSTGSIGRNALEIVAMFPERFTVKALAARNNTSLLAGQVEKFGPDIAVVFDETRAIELKSMLPSGSKVEIMYGQGGYRTAATYDSVNMVVTAIVGAAGLTIRMPGNPPNKFRSDAVPSLASFELPGTSGGPVFAFRPWGIDWVGIVSEVGDPPYSDVIIAPSRFIGDDGRIMRPPTML